MTVVNDINWQCFVSCVGDLLTTDEVRSMKRIPHHPGTSCYEHSVFVAYIAFRLARRWNLDYVAAARGYVDDIILPSETRKYLISAFDALAGKHADRPRKKHGNIPL